MSLAAAWDASSAASPLTRRVVASTLPVTASWTYPDVAAVIDRQSDVEAGNARGLTTEI